MNRNHFDRVVHFSFGFLLAYPMEELFRVGAGVRGWLLYYLPIITVLGLSGFWEIIESWVASAVHPELGIAYLGSQGDIWDAQKDIAVALYGRITSYNVCYTKLLRSAELLLTGDYTISEIADMIGFSSPAYFATCFKKQFDCKPSDYKG